MVSVSRLKPVLCKPNVGFFLVAVFPSHGRLIEHGAVVFDSAVASPFLAGPFSLFVDDTVVVGGYYGYNNAGYI